MAVSTLSINIPAKKLVNRANSALKHTFWRSNFNMPVLAIYSNVSDWLRFVGPFTYTDGIGTTSYDLSGFSAGFEIVAGTCIFDFENTGGSSESISASLFSKWVDTDNSTTLLVGANGVAISGTLPAGTWSEYAYTAHIGVDSDEVDTSGTYYLKSSATGSNPITELSTAIAFSNVPNVAAATLDASKRGYIWVEGANLCFVNGGSDSGGGWKHAMVGTSVASRGTQYEGALWIDTSNNLRWVGADGYEYVAAWKVKQFASSFSNSATAEVYAGTSKAGAIWVDMEFGQTHLGYIGYDGYKYLTGAGDNPYA